MRQRPQNFRINRNAKLAKGLVFAMLGGGASTLTALDSSGYGNHGALTSMDPPTDWVWNTTLNRWVLDFDGSDDYVAVGSGLSLKTTGDCTWSGWIKTANTVVAKYAWGDMGVSGSRGLQFEIDNALSGTIYVASSATALFGGAITFANAALWTHYANVFIAGVGLYFYENGSLKTSFTTSPPATQYRNALGFVLGNRGDLNAACYLSMQAADMLIHNRALAPVDIAALADPSNVSLSGLIVDPRRRLFSVAAGNRRRRVLCGAA